MDKQSPKLIEVNAGSKDGITPVSHEKTMTDADVSPEESGDRLDLPSAQTRLNKMSVLLVEDNTANQMIVQELLECKGATVALAENGEEALALLKNVEDAFDIVLMDIQMPVMNGYQATAEIRQLPGLSQLPIVAMSGNAMDSDRKAAFAAGMNAYISKPFKLDVLVEKLIQLCHWDQLKSARSPALTNKINKATENEQLDLDETLERFSGNVNIYHRALQAFSRDSQRLLATLPESLRGSNHLNMLASLHSIKGMAANLGAEAVAKVCEEMEVDFALKTDTTINQANYRRDLALLQSRLLNTCQRIQQILTVP